MSAQKRRRTTRATAERRGGLPRGVHGIDVLQDAVSRRSDPPTPCSASAPGQPPGRHRRAARSNDGRAHRFGWWDRFGWRDRLGWRDRFGWPRFGQEQRGSFGRRGQRSSIVACRVVPTFVKDREHDPGWWGLVTPTPCAGDIAPDRPDTQVADGSLQQPNAAAGRLGIGRVARLGASESQGVGHGVKVVTRRACERERVVAQVEMAAGTSQFQTALPHALRHLPSLAAGRTRRLRVGTGAGAAGDRRRSVGAHHVSDWLREGLGCSPDRMRRTSRNRMVLRRQ